MTYLIIFLILVLICMAIQLYRATKKIKHYKEKIIRQTGIIDRFDNVTRFKSFLFCTRIMRDYAVYGSRNVDDVKKEMEQELELFKTKAIEDHIANTSLFKLQNQQNAIKRS